jgi:hypothetical protein
VASRRFCWEGGIKGRLVIYGREKIIINNAHTLIQWLIKKEDSDDDIDFESEEMKILGVVALFLAIREIKPYKRGTVLENACSSLGGANNMIGYYYFPTLLGICCDSTSFSRGCEALAEYLQPEQTESQPLLLQKAFDYFQQILGRFPG